MKWLVNYFRLWKDQHLKKFLMGLPSSHEPVIRSFGSWILNLLPLHNLCRLVRDSTAILEILVLLAMPIFMHCLNKGSSIGEGRYLQKQWLWVLKEITSGKFQRLHLLCPSIQKIIVCWKEWERKNTWFLLFLSFKRRFFHMFDEGAKTSFGFGQMGMLSEGFTP